MQEQQNSVLSSVMADISAEEMEKKKQRRHSREAADNLILLVAPVRSSGDIPPLCSFFPVRCRDLSSGGVGFFMPAKPSFQKLVVQLGSHLNAIYMDAEVKHIDVAPALPDKKVAWDSNGKEHHIELGTKPFVVGCQFLQRLPGFPE